MQEKKIILITFIIVIFLIVLLVTFIVAILYLLQKKQYSFQHQLDVEKNRFENEILKSQLEMQENTMQNMSRELHDNIGQFISLAKLHLNTTDLEAESSGGIKVRYAVDLLSTALDDLRDLSKSLSLELIKSGGLVKAIENQVEHLKKAARYNIHFEVLGNYEYLEDQKEIILFRILQETINNIIRHAHAKTIRITLNCSSACIVMVIEDDGSGFNVNSLLTGGHSFRHGGGISNMKYRASLIGAQLGIESHPNSGTTIRITTPLNKDYDPAKS